MKTKGLFKTFRTPALIFFFGLVSLFFISFAVNGFRVNNKLTGILEAVSATVGTAAVFAAAYFAFQELEEASKTRHIEVADRLFTELNSPKNIDARRHIFQNLKEKPELGLKRLKQADQDAIKQVLNSLDRVAFLTREGWIPVDLIMPWMHPMIAKSWEKLEPYVIYERERRNEPYYYEHAGELAERCRKWRVENLANTETKWVNNAL